MKNLEEKIQGAIIRVVSEHHKEAGELCCVLKAEFKFEVPNNNNCEYKGYVTAFGDHELDKMSALEYAVATR